MRVHRSLEVVYVDELVDVPAVSERRADRQSVLGVRVELFPRLHTQTYDGIPHQVKQRAGDRGITAEDTEKSQHTDFNNNCYRGY